MHFITQSGSTTFLKGFILNKFVLEVFNPVDYWVWRFKIERFKTRRYNTFL